MAKTNANCQFKIQIAYYAEFKLLLEFLCVFIATGGWCSSGLLQA